MGRDGVFPKILAKVDPHWDVPINALIFCVTPSMLLFLIYVGNTTAFYGFMSGVLLSMMSLYLASIGMQLYKRLKGEAIFGPWMLGRFGVLINTGAVIWISFLVVVLSLPSQRPVTAGNM